jgi:hypothetical protein
MRYCIFIIPFGNMLFPMLTAETDASSTVLLYAEFHNSKLNFIILFENI